MAILNLEDLSAYALTIEGLEDYYNKSTNAPYAAFPQAYKYTTKSKTAWGGNKTNHYDKTGYPNAWIDQSNTYLDLSAADGPNASKVSVESIFKDKVQQDLTYLWQWIQKGGTGTQGDSTGTPGEFDALMYFPESYNSKVSGFDYTNNMNSFGISDYGPASITTTGLTSIDIGYLETYGVDDNGDSTGNKPTVDWNTDVTNPGDSTVDYNWQPTASPSETAPGGLVYQTALTTPVYDGAPITYYLGGAMTSDIDFSNTNGSSTSTSKGGSSSWGISGTVGYVPPEEEGGITASVSAQYAYSNTWDTVQEVDYSETSSVSAGIEIEAGFSVTIEPTPSSKIQSGMTNVQQSSGESGYGADNAEQEQENSYVIDAGDEVYMATQASNGSYNNDFATPWIYEGSVSDVVLGSNTPNNSTVKLDGWEISGQQSSPVATPRTLSNQIGIIGQYGLDYDYFDVVMDSASSNSLIEVQGNNLLVYGATSATTVVASDFEVLITVTPPSNDVSSRMRSAREFSIKKQIKKSLKDDNVKTLIDPKTISKNNTSILDLNQIRQNRVNHAKADGRPANYPGYHITKENDQKGQVIILSTEHNIVDLENSRNDQSIIAVGKKDRISLGNGNDLVDTSGAKGFSSAYTGKGHDTVYSGKGDYISTSKGNDQIIALGQSYIYSGTGKDNIAFKNKAMAIVSDFQPGDDILQKISPNKSGKLLDGSKFNLSEIATSRGRTYLVTNKKGKTSGIISLDDKYILSNDDAKLNLALRQKDLKINKDDLINGYFDANPKERIGNQAKDLFENKGFADRDLYYQTNNKKHRRQFLANLQETLEFVYDSKDVETAIQSASEQSDWKGNDYPWLSIFESSIEKLADM